MHVFVFSVASVPGIAYAVYWKRNHQSDEEFEQTLRQNYSSKIQGNKDKKQDMVQFFEAMKDPAKNPEQDEKMMQVLRGGNGDIKRHYAVDDKLYGTEEGLAKRKEAENESIQIESEKKNKKEKLAKKKNKKKKNKIKQKKEQISDDVDDDRGGNKPQNSESSIKNLPSAQKAVVGVAAVGTLALIASVVGGKKGS